MDVTIQLRSKIKNLPILNKPSPVGEGARVIRYEGIGVKLDCIGIYNYGGVPYALLVSRNPAVEEWVRLSEAGKPEEEYDYCFVTHLVAESDKISSAIMELAKATNRQAAALEEIAGKMK